jgi:SAM-dependent methyltransferase
MVSMSSHPAVDHPSAWVVRFAPLIPQGEVLDLACGSGRHARLLAAMGHAVLAVDRDAQALAATAGSATNGIAAPPPSSGFAFPTVTLPLVAAGQGINTLQIDLESGSGPRFSWPFEPNRFAGIVVTNYLHRPLFPPILDSLAINGVLIYETFAQGNGRFGKPSNPDFLLEPGELLRMTGADSSHWLRIIAFEDGYIDQPKPAMVQRICVVKTDSDIMPHSVRLN